MIRVEHSICSPDIRMAHAELGDPIAENEECIWFSLTYQYPALEEGIDGILTGESLSSQSVLTGIPRPQLPQFGEFWSGVWQRLALTSLTDTAVPTEAPPAIERPTEVFSARATDIVRKEALSNTVEEILSILRSSFRNLKRISVDVEDDPEAEGGKWFSITLRLRGEIDGILESERVARYALRAKLRPEEYERFALSYDVVD